LLTITDATVIQLASLQNKTLQQQQVWWYTELSPSPKNKQNPKAQNPKDLPINPEAQTLLPEDVQQAHLIPKAR
jgi:hypothetical protein